MWPWLLGAGILWVMTDPPSRATRDTLPEPPASSSTRERSWIVRIDETAPHLTQWVPISVRSGTNTGVFFVSPDYWGVGSDPRVYSRIPLTPHAAQWVADRFDASLPTRKMVLDIENSGTRVGFTAFSPRSGESRNSQRLWDESNQAIRSRISSPPGTLFAGHKKDVIIGALHGTSPGKVIIYGGRYQDGSRVQPTSNLHGDFYVDYSHGLRLIRNNVVVNGVDMRLQDALKSRAFASLFSDEGPLSTAALRY